MAEEKEENKIEKKPRVPRRNTNKRVQNKKETVENKEQTVSTVKKTRTSREAKNTRMPRRGIKEEKTEVNENTKNVRRFGLEWIKEIHKVIPFGIKMVL